MNFKSLFKVTAQPFRLGSPRRANEGPTKSGKHSGDIHGVIKTNALPEIIANGKWEVHYLQLAFPFPVLFSYFSSLFAFAPVILDSRLASINLSENCQ